MNFHTKHQEKLNQLENTKSWSNADASIKEAYTKIKKGFSSFEEKNKTFVERASSEIEEANSSYNPQRVMLAVSIVAAERILNATDGFGTFVAGSYYINAATYLTKASEVELIEKVFYDCLES